MSPVQTADNVTKVLAVWGAVLGTFTLGWTLYRDLRDRPKLQITAGVRRLTVSADGQYYDVSPTMPVTPVTEQLFVVMRVVNIGRRPVVWQGWGGKFRKGEADPGFLIVGRKLPKMLQEGESHSEMTALQTNLDPASERVRMLYVWDAAHRNWVLPKKQFKKLKKEAREASSSRS